MDSQTLDLFQGPHNDTQILWFLRLLGEEDALTTFLIYLLCVMAYVQYCACVSYPM